MLTVEDLVAIHRVIEIRATVVLADPMTDNLVPSKAIVLPLG